MKLRAPMALLLASALCAACKTSSATALGMAVMTPLALGSSAASRSAGGCWATCQPFEQCNSNTGLCEAAAAPERVVEPEAAAVGAPLAATSEVPSTKPAAIEAGTCGRAQELLLDPARRDRERQEAMRACLVVQRPRRSHVSSP
jgi:hypothetical protein